MNAHTEKQLRSIEQSPALLYPDLIEHAPIAMIVVDQSSTIILCNNQAAAACGYSSGNQLLGTSFCALLNERDQEIFEHFLCQKSRPATKLELSLKRTNEPDFPADVTFSHITSTRNNDPALCSIFFQDVTLRKKAEEEKAIFERQIRVIYKMEAVGQLASGIAHDLNNNLGAISGYVELLNQMCSEGNERMQKYTSMISSATLRASDLINKLLTFARKNRLHTMTLDINQIVTDTVKLAEHSISKNIKTILKLQASHATIIGDPGQIQNAVLNMALNAHDAMPEGGTLTFSTANVVIDEEFFRMRQFQIVPGHYLRIEIQDTGSGMDKKTMSRLFEPFFTTKEIGKGTGLGLASVYGCVKSHNGYIDVESVVGTGSTFSLYFPAQKIGTPGDQGVSIDPGFIPKVATKRHILIIDDERYVREMLSDVLCWLGYATTSFGKAQEAITFYESQSAAIDVVILDYMMPEINGIQCFRTLKQINPNIRALMSSGFAMDDERATMLKEGVFQILQKPFISSQLAKAVTDALA